jgi:hypothetical protein
MEDTNLSDLVDTKDIKPLKKEDSIELLRIMPSAAAKVKLLQAQLDSIKDEDARALLEIAIKEIADIMVVICDLVISGERMKKIRNSVAEDFAEKAKKKSTKKV